jgi:hypothetical protein
VHGIVSGIPLGPVDRFEVASKLGVGRRALLGLAVDKCTAIEGSKQPLVRIHDKRVRVFDPSEKICHRRRCQSCGTVGAVHMHPEVTALADLSNTGQIVYNTGIRGTRRDHNAKESFDLNPVESVSKDTACHPTTVVDRYLQYIAVKNSRRCPHRTVDFTGSRETPATRWRTTYTRPSPFASGHQGA